MYAVQINTASVAENVLPITMKAGYLTRDVYTDPPTPIKIVPTEILSFLTTEQYELGKQKENRKTFLITYDNIEPTAGWLMDCNNASLDICLMYSFGKCYGKAKDHDPRTCHQIHVKREILTRLRGQYYYPHRTYFCRTMKCNIERNFIEFLTTIVQRRIALRYLEFKVEDILPTSGSVAYEIEYRNWLFSDNFALENLNNCICVNNMTIPPNRWMTNFISKFNLCPSFSMYGKCSMNSTCDNIHAKIEKALSKDKLIRFALQQLSYHGMEGKKHSENVLHCEPLLLNSLPTLSNVKETASINRNVKNFPCYDKEKLTELSICNVAIEQDRHEHVHELLLNNNNNTSIPKLLNLQHNFTENVNNRVRITPIKNFYYANFDKEANCINFVTLEDRKNSVVIYTKPKENNQEVREDNITSVTNNEPEIESRRELETKFINTTFNINEGVRRNDCYHLSNFSDTKTEEHRNENNSSETGYGHIINNNNSYISSIHTSSWNNNYQSNNFNSNDNNNNHPIFIIGNKNR